MKRTLFALLACLSVSAASAPAPAGLGRVERSTAKPADQFVACFVAGQDRASQPWSFVPRENGGGTLSNAGARGVTDPYFLRVADRGSKRDIRLEATNASSGETLLRAVDRCV
jgi:hypothetical protein